MLNYFFNSYIGILFSQIGMGFCMRIIIIGVIFYFFKVYIRFLPSVVAIATLLHYSIMREEYSNFTFITPAIILGMLLPEFCKMIFSINLRKRKNQNDDSSNVPST